jgi:flagellar hook capping protein FlgD
MRRAIALSIATLGLLAGLAAAEPQVTVTYRSGVPIIQLTGDFAGSVYSVYRAAAADPVYRLITDNQVLCIGECIAADYDAEAGQTYLYRFDVERAGGRSESFGPYPVTIPREQPLSVRISPNPGRGPATIGITLAGRPGDAPVETEVALYDLQGRALRTLHRGPLARGTTPLAWDGRDGSGRTLGSGLYFLRVRSAAGDLTARIARTR